MNQILLIGDSLVADNEWQERMRSYKVFRFGYPGEVTTGLLRSLPSIKKRVEHADVVMVMVGTNDLLLGYHDFTDTLKEIAIQLTRNYPVADVLLTSLCPMYLPHLPEDTIEKINRRIEAMTMQTGGCYLNIHQRFSDSDKQIFQSDGVHLTDAAYEIWTRTLLEHIAFLIEND
jgi:lysophospholipase L1-like esterase